MKLGMIGLGKMGANMAERLRRDGHEAVGFARFVSQHEDQTSMKVVAALRNQFGGHAVEKEAS